LLNRFFGLLGWRSKIVEEAQWNPRDRQVARWYAPVFLAGYLFSTATLLFVGVPIALRFLGFVVVQLFTHVVLTTFFWNTILFLTLNGLQLGIIVALIIKDHRRSRVPPAGWELDDMDDADEMDVEPDQVEANEA